MTTKSLREFILFIYVEQRQAAADPQTKPPDLGCESACIGCYRLQPRSPFFIIIYSLLLWKSCKQLCTKKQIWRH